MEAHLRGGQKDRLRDRSRIIDRLWVVGRLISLVKSLEFAEKIALANVISKGKEIDEASARPNSIREELADRGGDVTVHVLEGDTAKEILDLAKKQDSTFIIMSSQGKGRMKQIRVGIATFDVARMARRYL